MSNIYTLIGTIVGALIAFGAAYYVQKRNAALTEAKQRHDDRQRKEDQDRDDERHRRDVQREAAMTVLATSNVFMDHAHELTEALRRGDERRIEEVWPRYTDAWSAAAEARPRTWVTGPDELRDLLDPLRKAFGHLGAACDSWRYDGNEPDWLKSSQRKAHDSYIRFRDVAQNAVGVPAAGLHPASSFAGAADDE